MDQMKPFFHSSLNYVHVFVFKKVVVECMKNVISEHLVSIQKLNIALIWRVSSYIQGDLTLHKAHLKHCISSSALPASTSQGAGIVVDCSYQANCMVIKNVMWLVEFSVLKNIVPCTICWLHQQRCLQYNFANLS